jgi:hypothetical protein
MLAIALWCVPAKSMVLSNRRSALFKFGIIGDVQYAGFLLLIAQLIAPHDYDLLVCTKFRQ